MDSKDSDSKRLAAIQNMEEELRRYLELFADAFDELHGAIIRQVNTPHQYIGPHHDYPVMSQLESSRFPIFHESGFYRDDTPRHYTSILTPGVLAALLGGYVRPHSGFPRGAELASFLRSHKIGKRLNLAQYVYKDKVLDGPVDKLVGDAVERYLHLHGLNAPVEANRRIAIIRPLVFGTTRRNLDLSLFVPIAMTHFEVQHFPLSETTYIMRMPRRLQLGRARMTTLGSGAVQMVVGAATHAFVSNGWNLNVDNIDQVRKSLSQPSSDALDAIDSFFGALRVVTGVDAGYAQLLWVPRRWTLNYFCDLTPVYGTTLRRYPSEFDNYGWTRHGATVTPEDLNEVRRIYQAVVSSQSEAIRLALNRLNACLTRTDAADAVLDGPRTASRRRVPWRYS